MRKSLSLHLDLIRGLAAASVLFYHYSNHVLTHLPVNPHGVFPSIGHESVMVFFVLSGFVITYVLKEREKTFPEFMAKRLARLWSVLLPSLAIMLLCYVASKKITPHPFLSEGAPDHWFLRALSTIGFANYNSFAAVYVPWGGVTWSLTCEFWYYCLAAIWVFTPGKWLKWILGLVVAVGLGPKVMLLMPVWLMGAWAYHRSKTLEWSRPVSSLVMLGAAIGLVLLYQSGLKDRLLHFPGSVSVNLEFARYAPYFWVVGALMTLYILAAHCFASVELRVPSWIETSIRNLAGVSFFLYLTHPALMFLLQNVMNWMGIPEPFVFFNPLVVLLVSLVVGRPIEDSKRFYVPGLRRLLGGPEAKLLLRDSKAVGV